MFAYEFEGRSPQVHPEAFIAPTATLIGDVRIEKGASVWYGAVLRADICTIIVREGANIQDNSVVHGAPDVTVEIGAHSTVAHACVFHGDSLGEKGLVGNDSTVLDGAKIGAGTLVAAGSLVAPGTEPPGRRAGRGQPCPGQEADRGHRRAVLDRDERALLRRPGAPARGGHQARPLSRRSSRSATRSTWRGSPPVGMSLHLVGADRGEPVQQCTQAPRACRRSRPSRRARRPGRPAARLM
ncbi:gamma carbonic anhydrase family protein [Nocardioides convexus]|uniref:gamma carbonic anhydrase family protein n=1 Tax=Nocardioides convexus TaxID=2712224 RepID=UPI0024186BFF|nr:gamma carbonic anhydrase family protein [Nocardioides convexus]